jgi:(2Fe-2S) ferredoxin
VTRAHVLVCRGPDCASRGSQAVYTRMAAELPRLGIDEEVTQTSSGCIGPLCGRGPVVCCYPTGAWYAGVGPDDVTEIAERDVAGGEVVDRLRAARIEGGG